MMPKRAANPIIEAPYDCALCPRLSAFVTAQRSKEPTWFNGPVRSFGDPNARLVIVGLAPGLKGANRTGRPFTGDYAGDLLYATLKKFGFSQGSFAAHPDDGLSLHDCIITNAVRCVPPENKPTPAEINTCRQFLAARLDALPKVRAIVALGRIAHESILPALGQKRSAHPFGHGTAHAVTDRITLFDSYHCSRYNTNTRVLTTDMFEAVFASVRTHLDNLPK
ncbi:MAG: uracil-DNA glycosylase [Hyphomicrobiaceae bacterium]|nr:uracil-DNA glycosylase [Hyphomicrobiaceae bacterium]